MVDLSLIEQRLATLEQEVAEMKKQLVPTARQVNWVDEFAGSMKEFPEFSEVVRLGRELCAAQTASCCNRPAEIWGRVFKFQNWPGKRQAKGRGTRKANFEI